MSLTTCVLSKANYEEAVDWLEERLAELKLPKHEILTAELLLEENFFRLAGASENAETFSAALSVRKRFGDVSLRLSA